MNSASRIALCLVAIAASTAFIGSRPAKASPPPAVSVTTFAPTEVARTAAVFNGSVSESSGIQTVLGLSFEYGADTGYGTTVAANGGPGFGNFSASVSGLACGTTYHVRAFASTTPQIGYAKPGFLLALLFKVAYASPPSDQRTNGSDWTFSTGPCSYESPSSTGGSVSVSDLAKILAPGPATDAYLASRGYGSAAPAPAIPGCPAGFACVPAAASSSPALQAADRAPAFARDLQVGSQGSDVMALQRYLNAHGYAVASSGPGSPGSETDLFGLLTMSALKAFQAAHGIASTGNLGPATRAYLESSL